MTLSSYLLPSAFHLFLINFHYAKALIQRTKLITVSEPGANFNLKWHIVCFSSLGNHFLMNWPHTPLFQEKHEISMVDLGEDLGKFAG